MADEVSKVVQLMNFGGKSAELFGDTTGEMARPDQPMKMYRGEATLRNTPLLGRSEVAGQWYTPNPEKARRYPAEDAGIMGKLTRSFESTPEELIRGSYKAMTEHANRVYARNLENGILSTEKAQDIHIRNLNDIDKFHSKYLQDLREGKLTQDKLNILAKTSMEEGIFPDQKGKIDVVETFRRGNYPVAAGAGIAQLFEKVPSTLARGAGIAMLPVDMIMGAQKTALDPQEELSQITGVDATTFYQMPEEQFNELYNRYKLQALEAERERSRSTNRAVVGKDFVNAR